MSLDRSTPGRIAVRDYDFHPHESTVRVFEVPPRGVVRLDDSIFVSEGLFGNIALRHYAFRDEWFKINVTLDRAGNLVETDPGSDHPAFAFNCDISTPMHREHNDAFAVDLFADVLVRADGKTFAVKDVDRMTEAAAAGMISEVELSGARKALDRLTTLIARRQLLDLLHAALPFGPSTAPPASSYSLVPSADVPQIQPGRRPSWPQQP